MDRIQHCVDCAGVGQIEPRLARHAGLEDGRRLATPGDEAWRRDGRRGQRCERSHLAVDRVRLFLEERAIAVPPKDVIVDDEQASRSRWTDLPGGPRSGDAVRRQPARDARRQTGDPRRPDGQLSSSPHDGRRPGQPTAADPGSPDHVGMGPEDEPARRGRPGRRRAPAPRAAHTYAGSTTIRSASLPVSSEPMTSSSPSARAPSSVPSRSQSSGVEDGRVVTGERSARHLRVGADAHDREDRRVRTARHVRARARSTASPAGSARAASRPAPMNRFDGGQCATCVPVSTRRSSSRSERWMAWARTVRAPEPAGAVVDVDVVDGVGEEPPHLGDLERVLGQVGLPPRAGRPGERRRFARASRCCTRSRTGASPRSRAGRRRRRASAR